MEAFIQVPVFNMLADLIFNLNVALASRATDSQTHG